MCGTCRSSWWAPTSSETDGAGCGTRTHTPFRTTLFESAASAIPPTRPEQNANGIHGWTTLGARGFSSHRLAGWGRQGRAERRAVIQSVWRQAWAWGTAVGSRLADQETALTNARRASTQLLRRRVERDEV